MSAPRSDTNVIAINVAEFKARYARDAWARDRFYEDVEDGIRPPGQWTSAPIHVRQLYWSLYDRLQVTGRVSAPALSPIMNVLQFIRRCLRPSSTQYRTIEVRK